MKIADGTLYKSFKMGSGGSIISDGLIFWGNGNFFIAMHYGLTNWAYMRGNI